MVTRQKSLILNQNFKYYCLIFFLNAIEMIMETSASRVLAPSLGTTNIVWISIIGIILLANSLGNYIGGKCSEKYNNHTLLIITLFIASALVFFIPLMSESIPNTVLYFLSSVEFSAVVSSLILFFAPTLALSIATPVLMKNILENTEYIGKGSGVIHAVIAIGSLFGTFVGGFFLIPTFGCKTIIYILAIVLSLLPFCFIRKVKKKIYIAISAWCCLLIVFIIGNHILHNPNAVLNPESNATVSIDGDYSRIIVQNIDYQGERIRLYKSSAAFSSATFLDEDKKNDLVFDYSLVADKCLDYDKIHDMLMIGGAAYMYPKYYISHFPDKRMDVVEIEPKSIEIAKKYFFLDDLIRDYDLNNNNRLGLYTNDGRMFLNHSDKTYDCVMNDAYSGGAPVASLSTVEAITEVKKHLSDDGVYLMNMLGSVSGKNSLWIRSEYKTALEVFPYVYIIYVHPDTTDDTYTNFLMVCANSALTFNKDLNVRSLSQDELASPAVILTDDYCPVDQIANLSYLEVRR